MLRLIAPYSLVELPFSANTVLVTTVGLNATPIYSIPPPALFAMKHSSRLIPVS